MGRLFNSEQELKKTFGQNAKKIQSRIQILSIAKNLKEVPSTPPERRHPLEGKYAGKFAVDLNHPFRLVFEPMEEIVSLPNGGLDLSKVISIKILEVVDYH